MAPETSITLPDDGTLQNLNNLLQDNSAREAVLQVIETDPETWYNDYEIPKGNGQFRKISAPQEPLKSIQRAIGSVLGKASLPDGVYGFRENTSAYKGLRQMLSSLPDGGNLESVYSTDIKDFFPSIDREQVKDVVYHFFYRTLQRMKKGPQLPPEDIESLADLITDLCCVQGHLAQGSPASPALSNMVGATFDRPIMKKALDSNQVYGRYADDVVIFSTEHIPQKTRGLVESMIESCGFRIARSKTEYSESKNHYQVWGVDVIPASEESGLGLRFKLPTDVEKRWEKEALVVLNSLGKFENSEEIMNDKEVQKFLGRLSHAYNVTLHGNTEQVLQKMNRTVGGKKPKEYFLPDRLERVWKIFLDQNKDIVPASAPNWYRLPSSELSYQEVTSHEILTLDIFQQRIEKYCADHEIDIKSFRSKIEEQKGEIIQTLKDESRTEYLDLPISKNIDELQEHYRNSGDLRQAEITEAMVVAFVAFRELSLAGELEKFGPQKRLLTDTYDTWKEDFSADDEPNRRDLLPFPEEDLGYAWDEFLKLIKTGGGKELRQGLWQLFEMTEVTKEYGFSMTAPEIWQKKSGKPQKPWMSLNGFKD